jgi:hypothetical protein
MHHFSLRLCALNFINTLAIDTTQRPAIFIIGDVPHQHAVVLAYAATAALAYSQT